MRLLGWTLLAFVLLAVIVTMFVQDVGRVRRGEPINRWFQSPVYPDSPFYTALLIRVFGPYVVVFGILAALIVAIILAAPRP
jgi:NADH:ubiquinone oxidoreductase subunit 6 (subunit J)